MTAPSRRPEIRQRRQRKQKVTLLRKRYATAKTDADRSKIAEKVQRLYPGRAPEEVLRTAEK
jgi:hypothetical protein